MEAIVWNKKSIWSLVKLSEKVKASLFNIQSFITIGNAMDLILKVNKIHTGKKPSSFSQALPFNSECFCILCADCWVRKWTLFSLIYLQLFDKGLRSGGQVRQRKLLVREYFELFGMLNGCGACIFKKSVFCVVGMHSSGRGETFCRGRWSSDEALWSNIILLQSVIHKKRKNYCYYPVSLFPFLPRRSPGNCQETPFFPSFDIFFALDL